MKMNIKSRLLIFFLWCVPFSSMAMEEEEGLSKMNPLEMGVRMNLPERITTVLEGVLYVLGTTGYKLVAGSPAPQAALVILKRPIPPTAIQDKTVPIYQALLLIAGNDTQLVIDPDNKYVSFDFKRTARGNKE
jgi:hypothetical protein